MSLDPFDVGWLAMTIRLATPLILASMGELVAERTGMLNIGVEGMILMGALGGVLGATVTSNLFLGVVAGAVAGLLLALLGAVFCISARADQVIVGVGLILFAQGASTFIFRNWLRDLDIKAGPLQPVEIPILSDVPIIGMPLFEQNLIVYATYLLIPVIWLVLHQSRWGLLLRAAGDAPEAVDSGGHSVQGIRWVGMGVVGCLAGIAGAFLSIGQIGTFTEGMSAGNGFLVLAAVIFGRFHPGGVAAACLVFAGASALQLRLQSATAIPGSVWLAVAAAGLGLLVARYWGRARKGSPSSGFAVGGFFLVSGLGLYLWQPSFGLPTQAWLALPFIVTLVVLASQNRPLKPPAALTVAFDREAQ